MSTNKTQTPPTQCKKCKGSGERRKGDPCKPCRGSGWVTLSRDEAGNLVVTPAARP